MLGNWKIRDCLPKDRLVLGDQCFERGGVENHDGKQRLHRAEVSALALFLTFSGITLSSFGGAMFWARRALVERQRWLTEQEFVELIVLGQLLPGPPVLNLTVMVGYRFGGWKGAVSSVAWPCLVVIGLGVLYQHYGAVPQVQQALATAVKNSGLLPRRWRSWLFGMLAFVGIGVLRWTLPWVIGVLAPFAVVGAWKEKE